MLNFDGMEVSEEIDVNKTSISKSAIFATTGNF